MRSKFFILFILVLGSMLTLGSLLKQYPSLTWIYILLPISAPFIFLLWTKSHQGYAKKLLAKGYPTCLARILSVEDTGLTFGKINYGISMKIEVLSVNEAPFVTTIESWVSRVAVPFPGEMIKVVYNPQNHQEIALL